MHVGRLSHWATTSEISSAAACNLPESARGTHHLGAVCSLPRVHRGGATLLALAPMETKQASTYTENTRASTICISLQCICLHTALCFLASYHQDHEPDGHQLTFAAILALLRYYSEICRHVPM